MLHEVVRENLETFLAQARARTEHGFGVPRFVEEELRAFIRCGIINHGFARVRCGTCRHEFFVAFSCKRRGACPSCSGRRAAECGAHLGDEVFPKTPTRMWTLTFPRRLRFALAKDARLATTILGIWHRALASFYRLLAKKDGFWAMRTGAVTFVHRFSSSLALNVHFHTVMPDGVFAVPAPDEERASFIALPPPTTEEVEHLLTRVVKRVTRCMTRYFEGRSDDVALDAMDALAAASMATRKDGALERRQGRQEAFLEGFSLHAATHLHGNDRAGLERLCRYGARGPLSLGRLTKAADGKVRYTMKRVIRGKQDLVITGLELVEKLAVLIPPPRVNLVRYHGVFAPGSKLRPLVVPASAVKGCPKPDDATKPDVAENKPPPRDGTLRIDWASLLKRVFQVDILACAKCGDRRYPLTRAPMRPIRCRHRGRAHRLRPQSRTPGRFH